MLERIELPFELNSRGTTYFILQAPNLSTLARGKTRGVWAVSTATAREINFYAKTSERIVFFFCVRSFLGIYGVAMLQGNSVVQPGPGAALSPEFPIQWARSFRLSMRTAYNLKTANQVCLRRPLISAYHDHV